MTFWLTWSLTLLTLPESLGLQEYKVANLYKKNILKAKQRHIWEKTEQLKSEFLKKVETFFKILHIIFPAILGLDTYTKKWRQEFKKTDVAQYSQQHGNWNVETQMSISRWLFEQNVVQTRKLSSLGKVWSCDTGDGPTLRPV